MDITKITEARKAAANDFRLALTFQEAVSAIRAFVEFVETLDTDDAGVRFCPPQRVGIEARWQKVQVALNDARRVLMLRSPIDEHGMSHPEQLCLEDREWLETLTDGLFPSALTRYAADGRPYEDACMQSIEPPEVGRTEIQSKHLVRLGKVADRLKSHIGSQVPHPAPVGKPMRHNQIPWTTSTPLHDQVARAFDAALSLLSSMRSLLHAVKNHEFKTTWWAQLSSLYAPVYLNGLDLQRALTKEVREEIRKRYPLGSPPARLVENLSPKHTHIELLADEVLMYFTSNKFEVCIALEDAARERETNELGYPDSRHLQSVRVAQVWTDWKPDHHMSYLFDLFRGASALPLDELRIHIEQEQRAGLVPRASEVPIEPSDDDLAPLDMFPKIVQERLKKAVLPNRKTMKVRFRDVDGQRRYSISDARRLWQRDMKSFGQFT